MATFLLDVGTEELPASFVEDALAQWRDRLQTDDLEAASAFAIPARKSPKSLH